MSCSVVRSLPEKLFFVLVFCSAVLFLQLPLHANQSISLSWNSSGDPNVAGYKIYYGVVSGDYTNQDDVGDVTAATVTGLAGGATYYFAATTYDRLGNESDFSNEIAYKVPATTVATSVGAALAQVKLSDGTFGFTVSGTAGITCVVQASTNFVNWESVETNVAPFTFVEAKTTAFRQRFFRAFTVSH